MFYILYKFHTILKWVTAVFDGLSLHIFSQCNKVFLYVWSIRFNFNTRLDSYKGTKIGNVQYNMSYSWSHHKTSEFKTWHFYFVNSTNILRAPNAIRGRSKIHWCTLKQCTAWHFFKLLTLAFLLTKTSKLDLITFINIITVMLFMKYLHTTAKIVFLPNCFVICLPVQISQNTTNLEATLHKILRLSLIASWS